MVVSQYRSLYRDGDDLFRYVVKRMWEERVGERWIVRKIELIYEGDEPVQPMVYRHGRIDEV